MRCLESAGAVHMPDCLERIRKARVCDVALETPLAAAVCARASLRIRNACAGRSRSSGSNRKTLTLR